MSPFELVRLRVYVLLACQGEADKISEAIDQWAQAAQQPDGGDAEALGRIVDELLQQEVSFAERNAKRFKAVNEAFHGQDFETIVNVVDILMQPLDKAINKLLQRTSILKAIRYRCAEDKPAPLSELKTSSRDFFFQWTRGEFGATIVSDFITQLKSEELARHTLACYNPSIMDTSFRLIVFGMADSWWRCSFVTESFPTKMFSLAACDHATFCQTWAEYRSIAMRCPECVDAAFSGPLLRSMDLTVMSEQEVQAFMHEFLGHTTDATLEIRKSVRDVWGVV